MFAETQLLILNEARDILNEIERESTRLQWRVRDVPIGETDAYDYGRLAEASSTAEAAIFNVLNTAQSYCRVGLTDVQLFNRKPEEVEVDA